MFKKTIITVSIILSAILYISAQNHIEALRYSQQFYSTTAKSDAMGNALSAVGADMSALTINPAGIAVLKNSQFTFTPNFILSNTEGSFADNTRNETKFGFNISNIGFAGSLPLNGIIKNVSFGLAWNSTNDFRQKTVVSAADQNGSILDFMVYNANMNRYSDFREDLAWRGWLINYDDEAQEYWSFVTDDGTYGIDQRKEIRSRGGMGELDFTTGINIADKLYIGGTLAMASINYREERIYTESGFPDIYAESADTPGEFILVNPDLIEYKQTLYTDGTGFNAKFGVLFQPFKFIRLGGAIHSPTYFEITEDYFSEMYINYPVPDDNGNTSYYPESETNLFDYSIITPFRANAGLAIILDAYPIGSFFTVPMTFSVDYEYVDYSSSYMNTNIYDSGNFDLENNNIEILYKETHNFRAGAEVNLGVVKFRGGYALYSSPYTADIEILDNAKMVYSGGIGFASKNSFLDLSYSYSSISSNEWIYDANNLYPEDPIGGIIEPKADLNNTKHFFKVTMGLRF